DRGAEGRRRFRQDARAVRDRWRSDGQDHARPEWGQGARRLALARPAAGEDRRPDRRAGDQDRAGGDRPCRQGRSRRAGLCQQKRGRRGCLKLPQLKGSNRRTILMTDLQKIVNDLSGLTVLEAAELAKLLEEKWGVSAAAAVAVAAGPAAGAAAPAAEETTEFTVVLSAVGDKKIEVIKEVRAITGLGLKVELK